MRSRSPFDPSGLVITEFRSWPCPQDVTAAIAVSDTGGWSDVGSDEFPIMLCHLAVVSDEGWRPNRGAGDGPAEQGDGCSYAGRVRFEVLGPLRVVEAGDHAGEDEVGRRLGGARQQLVLAMLLASANSVVSTDALV